MMPSGEDIAIVIDSALTGASFLDILLGMNAGDSYGAQARLNAAPESLRWVPAAGGITAPLTSQANRA